MNYWYFIIGSKQFWYVIPNLKYPIFKIYISNHYRSHDEDDKFLCQVCQ